MIDPLRAPFPWFGGKSRAAVEVAAALGDVYAYVEPFAGSLAVLLQRQPATVETVNDIDGHLVNVWRAIAWAPDEVAAWVDWPVTEADLLARHLWLVARTEEIRERVQADPDWYDAQAAGWWVWGACAWIGTGWCSGTGPWVRDGDRVVRGDAGQGVNRQLPHLGDAGQGVNRKLPHLGDAGQGGPVREWMRALSARLRRVRITCGDWRRVVTPVVTWRHGTCGVLLDPPYTVGHQGTYTERQDTAPLWQDVTAWAVEAGQRPDMRIVVCGYAEMWEPPPGWTTRTWTARAGYARSGVSATETLWCSPHCIAPDTRQASLW